MKKLFDVFNVASQINEIKMGFYSYISRRGIRYQEPVKWTEPKQKPFYDPSRSGDLMSMPEPKYDSPYLDFKDSKELENANEKVKKIFSLGYQKSNCILKYYEHELIEKVKNHIFDTNSREVKIAKYTARIRYYQSLTKTLPVENYVRKAIYYCIGKRNKNLRLLRNEDYKKFEWILETLNLVYKPTPVPLEKVTRKNSMLLLAKLKVEQSKEEKLAKLKKLFDEQKVPFLEMKIKELKNIKEKEEKYNLPVTVTDADIEDCIQKLEKVKVEVAKNLKKGYRRKIHPYFLEPYEDNLPFEKEKAAEIIRETQNQK